MHGAWCTRRRPVVRRPPHHRRCTHVHEDIRRRAWGDSITGMGSLSRHHTHLQVQRALGARQVAVLRLARREVEVRRMGSKRLEGADLALRQ